MLRISLLILLLYSHGYANEADGFENENLMLVESELSSMEEEDSKRDLEEEKKHHEVEKPRLLGELADINRTTRKTKQKLQDIKHKIIQMREEREEIQAQINQVGMDKSELLFKIKAAQKLEQREKEKTEAVYQEFYNLASQQQKAARQKALYDERIKIGRDQLNDARKALSDKKKELEELHRDVILAKSESRKNNRLLQRMIDKINAEVAQTNRHVGEMKKRLLSLVKVNPKLLVDLEKSSAEKQAALKQLNEVKLKVNAARLELAKQKVLLSSLKKKHKNSFADFERHKSNYQEELDRYNLKLEETELKMSEIDEKIDAVERASFKYVRALKAVQGKSKALDAQLEDRERSLEHHRQPASPEE